MGYKYKIVKDIRGNESGRCILPDSSSVKDWDFMRGKVGKKYSYCVKKGYAMETEVQDHSGYTTESPVCVKYADGAVAEKFDMLDLMRRNGDWPAEPQKKSPVANRSNQSGSADLQTLSVVQARSMEMIAISGVVFDTVSGKGLPFAQISVQNTTIGTATNDEGVFKLSFPDCFVQDTLQVAYLGYEMLKCPISKLTGKNVRLPLMPKSFQLAEVEIIALSPEEVIRRVVADIPENYGKDSVILTAFIRSQKFAGGKLAEYTEAIVEDLKTGYGTSARKDEKEKSLRSNIPLLLKGRVISDTNLVNTIGDIGKSAGCLGCNFIHDFVEFHYNTVLDEKYFKYYTFKMEELIKPEGGKIYHIWFDQKKGVKETLWKGELFIDASDFALLKITQKPSFEAFDQFEKQKYNRQFTILNSTGWYREMPIMEWTTTYSSRNGKYFLNTIRIENWLTFINPVRKQQVKFAHKNEVVVTDVTRDPERIRNFRGDKSIGVNQRWDQIVGKGDEHFWAGYNYLPIEEKLREGLRKMVNK